jgi:Tfp pilus assembly protein PilF
MMERIEKLKVFLSKNPDDSFIRHALALEYVKLGEDGEAKRLFEQLLEKDQQYIGSYYHLAALLQRTGESEAAIKCYEKGMEVAKTAGDQHSYNELKSALEELLF